MAATREVAIVVSAKGGTSVRRTFGQVSASAQKASMAVGGLVKKLFSLPAVLGGVGSAALVGTFSDAAANAEETAALFDDVFGPAAQGVRKDLDDFAAAAGRSTFALEEMAASFGALIRPMGFTREETARLSTELTILAEDLASRFNKEVPEAALALRAALVGEAEPLRRFGVQISAARIETEAFAQGLATNKKEVTSYAKALATLSLITRQAAETQGDAIRTAESFTNRMKDLKGAVNDLRVEFGQEFNQAVLDTIDRMGGLDAVSNLARTAFGSLTVGASAFVRVGGSVVSRVDEFLEGLGGVNTILGQVEGGINKTIEVLGPLISQIADFATTHPELAVSLLATWGSGSPFIGGLVLARDTVGPLVEQIVKFASEHPKLAAGLIATWKLGGPLSQGTGEFVADLKTSLSLMSPLGKVALGVGLAIGGWELGKRVSEAIGLREELQDIFSLFTGIEDESKKQVALSKRANVLIGERLRLNKKAAEDFKKDSDERSEREKEIAADIAKFRREDAEFEAQIAARKVREKKAAEEEIKLEEKAAKVAEKARERQIKQLERLAEQNRKRNESIQSELGLLDAVSRRDVFQLAQKLQVGGFEEFKKLSEEELDIFKGSRFLREREDFKGFAGRSAREQLAAAGISFPSPGRGATAVTTAGTTSSAAGTAAGVSVTPSASSLVPAAAEIKVTVENMIKAEFTINEESLVRQLEARILPQMRAAVETASEAAGDAVRTALLKQRNNRSSILGGT